MKLLVIAATGNLGKAIVNAALRDVSTSPSWARRSSTKQWPRRSSTSATSCCVRCGYVTLRLDPSRFHAIHAQKVTSRSASTRRWRPRLSRRRRLAPPVRHRRDPRHALDAPQGQETRQEQVQQGPGRVQGRRRDVLLPALHDDARRLPLRLSIQLTPRRGRARRPNGQRPRETRPTSRRSSDRPRR
jgi:hypothetical protein